MESRWAQDLLVYIHNTRTNIANKKQTDGQIQMSQTYTQPPSFVTATAALIMMETHCWFLTKELLWELFFPLHLFLLDEQVARGRVPGRLTADRSPLLPRLVAEPSWAPFPWIVIAFYSLEQLPCVMYTPHTLHLLMMLTSGLGSSSLR